MSCRELGERFVGIVTLSTRLLESGRPSTRGATKTVYRDGTRALMSDEVSDRRQRAWRDLIARFDARIERISVAFRAVRVKPRR